MLTNGLGKLLDAEIPSAKRFADLFSGSGAVASFVATRHQVPVLATDLQTYSRVLSAAVIERTEVVPSGKLLNQWFADAEKLFNSMPRPPKSGRLTRDVVEEARSWCEKQDELLVTPAYGGHYFSPTQALWIDALRSSLPSDEAWRAVALAALIEAASYCSASPGHTAQPFQPTRTAKPFLIEAWARELKPKIESTVISISTQHAKCRGAALVGRAEEIAEALGPKDLAFIDPPYSGVHYSRFYHVLETIATGHRESAIGVGRYPANSSRPKSDFSMKTTASDALEALFSVLSDRRVNAIVTFPDHECSNGLSGDSVCNLAREYFTVRRHVVTSKLSTLGGRSGDGGSGKERAARLDAHELILQLSAS